MNKKDKRRLLDEITLFCESKGYRRDSIWTFSNSGTAKYSSMTRENFLGFGCSATTMLKDSFKINTFSLEEYIKRVDSGEPPTSLMIRFSLRQRMVYYLFWTAYSTEVDPAAFEKILRSSAKKMYGKELRLAEKLGFITQSGEIYKNDAQRRVLLPLLREFLHAFLHRQNAGNNA